VATNQDRAIRWRLIGLAGVCVVVAAAIVAWVLRARVVDHWLAVHTGTNDTSSVYYGFWSGFGSDITEFGVIGIIATGVYQLVKKYNCHEPGCWRVGNHPAAGGQFSLCYRHHPDYMGRRPTHDLIVRMHRQDVERQQAMAEKLHAIHEHSTSPQSHGGEVADPTP